MGEHRALLVANAKYRDDSSLPDLMAPINDMLRFRDALTHPAFGVFERDHVDHLADAPHGQILESLGDFFQSADPDDTLLLYYSGHGVTDINNNFFLCAKDTNVDRLLGTAVWNETVNQMMRSSAATTFIVILDCCKSGSWKSTSALPAALRGEGRFVLASSRPGQNSSDATVRTDSSPFTRFLVEAIETAELDTDSDGYVDIDAVYKHVDKQLKSLKGQQAQRDYGKSTATVALARRPSRRLIGGGTVAGRTETEETALEFDSAGLLNTSDGVVIFGDKIVNQAGATQPPSLSVSPEEVTVDVGLDDLPIVERVYVTDRSELGWTAESDYDWIALQFEDARPNRPAPKYVRLRIAPDRPGVHRGKIYIHPNGPGRVVRVPVLVGVSPGVNPRAPQPRSDSKEAPSALEGALVVDNITKASPAPRTKRRQKSNRELLEDELRSRGFELDIYSPNLWYADKWNWGLPYGRKRPRVAIRPPRIRIEDLDQANGKWLLRQSFSLEDELEAAVKEISTIRRRRPVPTQKANQVSAQPGSTADEKLRQFRKTATPKVSNPTAWQDRMSSELRNRFYIDVKPNEWLDPASVAVGAPTVVRWTETTLTIEEKWATKNPTTHSFEMERQFDEALAAIDRLSIGRGVGRRG